MPNKPFTATDANILYDLYIDLFKVLDHYNVASTESRIYAVVNFAIDCVACELDKKLNQDFYKPSYATTESTLQLYYAIANDFERVAQIHRSRIHNNKKVDFDFTRKALIRYLEQQTNSKLKFRETE